MDKDILIVGGGPAGLSTALHLQRLAPELAARVLVLEKAQYPRPKLCAGGLVADAVLLLRGLGLDVDEIPHVEVAAAHFDFAAKGLTVRLPGTHTLRVIRRDEFDAWLAAKAQERGIEIRTGVNVRAILPDETGVSVETDAGTFRAQLVIGADGSNGLAGRCVQPHAPLHTARALEVLTTPNGGHAVSDAYFDFSPVPAGIAGYTWDFPTQVKGQPMRCWGIYDMNIGGRRVALKETLAVEMARLGFNLGDYTLKGHPIRWFDLFNPLSVPRILLAGDAAGADPLFGEGISMALGYGRLAASEAVEAVRRGDFRLKGYRWRVLSSPLGQTLTARWVLAYIIYCLNWKWFQILLWRWLKPLVIVVAWIFVLNWARRMH